ncbi:MAG: serine hydrolase [Clostridia bacterium]|nr:serine hydrolase [Clostridia bacterium]
MKKIVALALCLLILAGCGSTRMDKTSEYKKFRDDAAAEDIQGMCRRFYEDNGLMGLSVGVYKNGEVRFFNFGRVKAEGAAITEDNIFELGTLSEMFTGIMYSEWLNKQYFTKTVECDQYFPYMTELINWNGRYFTSGELATHTAGLPAEPDNLPEGQNPYEDYDKLQVRKYLSTHELERQPGTSYERSKLSMGMLGYILETGLAGAGRISDIEALFTGYFVKRMMFTGTEIQLSEAQEARRALPHDADGRRVTAMDYASLQGGGAVKSTPYELLVTMAAFIDKVGVDATLAAAMETAQTEQWTDGNISVGFGLNIGELDGHRYVWQSGDGGGYGSAVGFVRDTGTAVVVLTNNAVQVQELCDAVMERLQ